MVVVLVLAVAATVSLVLANDTRWLRLGVLAALWAALFGVLLAIRFRKQVADRENEVSDLQSVYELELEREVAARREYELEVEADARKRVEEASRADLAELRSELQALRDSLERLTGGEVLVERYALQARSTRMRALSDRDGRTTVVAAEPDRAGIGAAQRDPATELIARPTSSTPGMSAVARGPRPTTETSPAAARGPRPAPETSPVARGPRPMPEMSPVARGAGSVPEMSPVGHGSRSTPQMSPVARGARSVPGMSPVVRASRSMPGMQPVSRPGVQPVSRPGMEPAARPPQQPGRPPRPVAPGPGARVPQPGQPRPLGPQPRRPQQQPAGAPLPPPRRPQQQLPQAQQPMRAMPTVRREPPPSGVPADSELAARLSGWPPPGPEASRPNAPRVEPPTPARPRPAAQQPAQQRPPAQPPAQQLPPVQQRPPAQERPPAQPRPPVQPRPSAQPAARQAQHAATPAAERTQRAEPVTPEPTRHRIAENGQQHQDWQSYREWRQREDSRGAHTGPPGGWHPADPETTGAHTAGRSVTELLAAHGTQDAPSRHRRRAAD